MKLTEIAVIRLCDDDSNTNRRISIVNGKSYNQYDSYTRKVSIDTIGNPSNFYKALADRYDAHILDKFLSFSNGHLNIMTPISIDLINWLSLEETKNISLFEWENVVFEKEVSIAIKCSKFCFTNNTCKQNATFTLYNNANSINFTKSSFCMDFSLKTIRPQENVTQDMIYCDCIFGNENQNGKIDFSNFQFDGVVNFSNNTFGLEVNFENASFDKKANFSNAKFNHKANFSKTLFKDEARFNNAVFYDSADFNGATFYKDIYFHRTILKQDLQIYRAIFERVVNFYFVTFENIVNFSACVIQNPRFLNFVGIDTKNINQKKMKQYISKKAKDESEIKENIERNRTEINLSLQHAQNLKDSFRVIKDTLLSQNNLLEVQNWHKLELYANEIELEYKLEQGQNKKSNQKELLKFDWNKFKKIYNSLEWKKTTLNKQKNNILDFTLWIDTVILKLYRNTSNHHTNFTTILNFTLGMIVVYGLFLLLINPILPYMANYNGEFVSLSIIIVLGIMFLAIFGLCAILFLFFILIVCTLLLTMPFFIHILCCLIIYSVCLGLFYFIFNIIAFLIILTINPQLINPFIDIFKADSKIVSKLETQILKINNQDMQILVNLALKQFDINNKNIENPKDIIYNNENILFEFYNKIKDGKKKDYKNILNVLETKYLLQENKITPLQKLHDNISLVIISDIITENHPQKINDNYSAEEHIVNNNNKVIYILQAIENDNIRHTLKEIYINKTKKDILKTTNIVYSIILLLCIFSLQKTARKNSVIPS